jgi:hypothetical protein
MEFWEVVLVLVIALPILVLWLGCIIDIIGRPDMNGLKKAAWILAILVFPVFGSIIYVITRPKVIIAREGDMDVAWESPDSFPTSHTRAPQ